MSWLLWIVLQWTLGCMCLFKLEFSVDVCPGPILFFNWEAFRCVKAATWSLLYSVPRPPTCSQVFFLKWNIYTSSPRSSSDVDLRSFPLQWFCPRHTPLACVSWMWCGILWYESCTTSVVCPGPGGVLAHMFLALGTLWLGSNSGSAFYWLCDFGQVRKPLCALVSPFVKWVYYNNIYFIELL